MAVRKLSRTGAIGSSLAFTRGRGKTKPRPEPSTMTQALVEKPPRERPSASRLSRCAEDFPVFAAPAAFWCARIVVPSRNAMPSLMPSRCCANSSRRSHTPWRLQRIKVCAAIHHGPRAAECCAISRHSRAARRSPRWCVEGCRARSCGVGGTARSAVPVHPIEHLSKRHSQLLVSCPQYRDRHQELTGPSPTVVYCISTLHLAECIEDSHQM